MTRLSVDATPSPRRWHIDVDGGRVDTFPWRIGVTEFGNDDGGPATAILSGLTGDKPLGVVAAHALIRALDGRRVRGRVLVIPCANPYGLQAGTRHNPDLVELNRRFPGRPEGLLSDQLAHALMTVVCGRVDAVIDLHSGTPTRTTEYIYDYGNLGLSASFGYLPVMTGKQIAGQLCTAAKAAGLDAVLVEFGGADRNDTATAVAGCLNMLRYRGHLDDDPTGPDTVAVLDRVRAITASRDGILEGPLGPQSVGQPVPPGVIGWVSSAVTGERLETFTLEEPGNEIVLGPGFGQPPDAPPERFVPTAPPTLMLAQATPSLVRPGALLFMMGWTGRTISTARSHVADGGAMEEMPNGRS